MTVDEQKRLAMIQTLSTMLVVSEMSVKANKQTMKH